jgi:hypothetical protein
MRTPDTKDWRKAMSARSELYKSLLKKENLFEELKDAFLKMEPLFLLRPRVEYHEDYGIVLWWTLPFEEPPFVGRGDFEVESAGDGPTHWSPLPDPKFMTISDGGKIRECEW